MMTLKEVPIGSTVTIKKVCATGPLKRRIVDMGLTKGTPVTVRRVAPLGDPLEVTMKICDGIHYANGTGRYAKMKEEK